MSSVVVNDIIGSFSFGHFYTAALEFIAINSSFDLISIPHLQSLEDKFKWEPSRNP